MSQAPLAADPQRGEWPGYSWSAAVPLAVLLPFVALTALAFPQGDDLCFGWEWRERGLVGMLGHFYRALAGRTFANTIIVLPFIAEDRLGISLLAAYRAMCAAALLAAIALAFWAASGLFRAARLRQRVFLGGALACALVAGAPAPNDFFFWVSQIGNYTLAAIAALAAMFWLARRAEERAALSWRAVVVLGGVGFITAQATEISGAILFAIVSAAFVQRLLTPGAPRQPLAYAVILAAIAAGTLIVAAAPANALRIDIYGQSHAPAWNALAAVPKAVLRLLHYLYLRAVSPALVGWIAIVALATWHHDRRPGAGAIAAKPWTLVWLPLGTALVATYGALWIGEFAMGQFLPPRARTHLHFILVGGLTLTTIDATRACGERVRGWYVRRMPALTARRLGVAAMVLLVATPHGLAAAWTALHDGRALAAAIDDRFARLAAGEPRDLVLPPLPARGWPVVVVALPQQTGDWVTDCLAWYYRVPSVRLGAPGV